MFLFLLSFLCNITVLYNVNAHMLSLISNKKYTESNMPVLFIVYPSLSTVHSPSPVEADDRSHKMSHSVIWHYVNKTQFNSVGFLFVRWQYF